MKHKHKYTIQWKSKLTSIKSNGEIITVFNAICKCGVNREMVKRTKP